VQSNQGLFSTLATIEEKRAMRSVIASAVLLALLCGVAQAEPKVGDKAPDFKLQGSDGKEYSLADFAGKKTVVVAWFPKAFTRGCTAECKNMKEAGDKIREYDVAYFTASVDKPEDNAAFAKSLGLDFPILSDPSKKTAEAYGVVHEGRPVPERWTFYIGPDGTVKAVEKKVNTAEAAAQIAQQLKSLGVKKN
jgi:peroxiredoxin Q/BCP